MRVKSIVYDGHNGMPMWMSLASRVTAIFHFFRRHEVEVVGMVGARRAN